MNIPGSSGFSVFGDKSLEFYLNPLKFCTNRTAHYNSSVFLTRLLNKSTYFICNFETAKEFLKDESGAFETDYKKNWGGLFGNTILFCNDSQLETHKMSLQRIFRNCCHGNNPKNWKNLVHKLTDKYIDKIEVEKPCYIYDVCKEMATELCLSAFLGIDAESQPEFFDKVTRLTIHHWHGIISIPIDSKIASLISIGLGRSSYVQALHAKQSLETLIRERLNQQAANQPEDENIDVSNMLLMTSALIPKSMASILSNCIIQMSIGLQTETSLDKSSPGKHASSSSLQSSSITENLQFIESEIPLEIFLESCLLETLRLYPPFIALKRQIVKQKNVAGHVFEENHAVMVMTLACHRDASKFNRPNEFVPARWFSHFQVSDKKVSGLEIMQEHLIGFGAGTHRCYGDQLFWELSQDFLHKIWHRFNWKIQSSNLSGSNEAKQDYKIELKYLPVTKIKNFSRVIFCPKSISKPHDTQANSNFDEDDVFYDAVDTD